MVQDGECRVHYHFIDRRSLCNLQSQIVTALVDVVLYPSQLLTLLIRCHCLVKVHFLQTEVLHQLLLQHRTVYRDRHSEKVDEVPSFFSLTVS